MRSVKKRNRHLILIRHGRPHIGVDAERRDPPLSALGQQQAERVARRLVLERVERVVTSPLQRARDTAQATAKGLALPLETDDGLAEVDFSGSRYISIEALRQQGGPAWQQFLDDPVTTLGGDPEDFREAVLAGLERILCEDNVRKIAIFTHGLPINVALSHCLGHASLTRFAPHYCSITRLVGSSLDDLTVLSINETGHFDPEEL
ncbi:MAG: histidine phosphatase family protein [Gammaproteobacteria bacterium]|nr:MAG: histidine phosphatase family protein [Gammaproteobacteria bacterium]